MENSMSAAIN
jgi:hypothetical protein